MKNLRRVAIVAMALLIGVGALTSLVTADHHEGGAEGFVPIFNGKDLAGWKGDMRYWSVRDGAITAETKPENPLRYNTFLIWTEGQVGDFELRVKYRIVGGNSGVQYRSAVTDDERYVAGGFQADIDSSPRYSGIHYEERGRGILAERGESVRIAPDGSKSVIGTFGDRDALQSLIKAEDWNDYTIIAKGNETTHIINGHVMSKVIDEQEGEGAGARTGIIALQAHQGPPMTVQFKDLMLKKME